ncbi:MAG: hypothetical protein SNJ71_00330, partial [Bacteroidales bacterium]
MAVFYDKIQDKIVEKQVGSGGSSDWNSIENKPTTFPPAAHNHDWNTIDNKPTTFPPATHNHDYFDIVSENPVRIKKGSYEIISPTTDTVNS